MFGIQFYPTPRHIADKMLAKIDFSRVRYVLEPSAGKGDIANALQSRVKENIQLDCVEIDKDLCAVLRSRGFTTFCQNFLQYQSFTRYDAIAMNPPFRDGEKHLLHALDIMQNGGQIVCLLNAETVSNPHTNVRIDLQNRLHRYRAHVEMLPKAFQDAERKTDVDIAIIYVNIPQKDATDILGRLGEAQEENESQWGNRDYLAENDVFRALVKQYELEGKVGLHLIDSYQQLQSHLPKTLEQRADILTVQVEGNSSKELSLQNRYMQELRYRYWSKLFGLNQMRRLLTNEIREEYQAQLDSFRRYDFNISNILQVQIDLSSALNVNIETAILKMFDRLTYEHSMGKNGNIHYYNGWKTNRACKVNHKIILPFYGLYDSRWGGSWTTYRAQDELMELEKILNYLDGGATSGEDCSEIITNVFRSSAKPYAGETIQCKYFDISFKKKGTVHLWFTNLNLLKKFNVFAGRKKNWLPGSYGKSQYSDLSTQEKSVVDSFEGEKEYRETLNAPAYFIGNVDLVMLHE